MFALKEGPGTAIQENSSIVTGQKFLYLYQLPSICSALWQVTDEDLAGKVQDMRIVQRAQEMCRIRDMRIVQRAQEMCRISDMRIVQRAQEMCRISDMRIVQRAQEMCRIRGG